MTPCTWDEILIIRDTFLGEKAEEELREEDLRARFDKWGGVPRTLIERPSLMSDFEAGIKKLDLEEVKALLGTRNMNYAYSGGIFHLLPAFSLTDGAIEEMTVIQRYSLEEARYWWASSQVEEEAWNEFRLGKEAAALDFVETLNNDPCLRGRSWESSMHRLVEMTGIQGRLRDLETGEVTENFLIDKSPVSFFSDFSEIRSESKAMYWRPKSEQNKACDLYIPSDGIMLQMTVAGHHPVKISGLEDVLGSRIFLRWMQENPGQKLKLVFLVHPSKFEEFGTQSYSYDEVDKEGNSTAASKLRAKNTKARRDERKSEVEKYITQYVMEVNIEDRIRSYRETIELPTGTKRKAQGEPKVAKKRRTGSGP
jgi:hypothetical protein